MSVFAISDLHLPLGIEKPMDVFGAGWENYVERTEKNWRSVISKNDTVLIGGDVSWAMYLEEVEKDFDFIHSLPGKKIITKGNHDYWWTTASKLSKFKEEKGFDDIIFLQNNAVLCEGAAICGSRGWRSPFEKNFTEEDRKIYERELIRLELSLKEGRKLSDKIIAMVHYPPDFAVDMLLDEYGTEICVYGHLHGAAAWEKRSDKERNILTSADFLKFMPKKIL